MRLPPQRGQKPPPRQPHRRKSRNSCPIAACDPLLPRAALEGAERSSASLARCRRPCRLRRHIERPCFGTANRLDCAVRSDDSAVLAGVHALRCAPTRAGGLRRRRRLRAAALCAHRRRRTDGALSRGGSRIPCRNGVRCSASRIIARPAAMNDGCTLTVEASLARCMAGVKSARRSSLISRFFDS